MEKMSHKKIFYKIFPKKAQAAIEFTFAFIVVVVMFYACVKALQWIGVAMIGPVGQHYQGLYSYPPGPDGGASTNNPRFNPVNQLANVDKKTMRPKMKLIFDGKLLKEP